MYPPVPSGPKSEGDNVPHIPGCAAHANRIGAIIYFKHVFQLHLFQLIHNTVETASVFAVGLHTDAVLLKRQRMFVVGAKREQVC